MHTAPFYVFLVEHVQSDQRALDGTAHFDNGGPEWARVTTMVSRTKTIAGK